MFNQDECICLPAQTDANKEVLNRLLELNHKIHEEEVKASCGIRRVEKAVVVIIITRATNRIVVWEDCLIRNK